LDGAVVMFDGGAMVSGGIESVGHGAQGQGVGFFAAEALSDEDGRLGEMESFIGADANALDDELSELFDRGLAKQFFVFREEFSAGGVGGELAELGD
jgi:hypothetical protein